MNADRGAILRVARESKKKTFDDANEDSHSNKIAVAVAAVVPTLPNESRMNRHNVHYVVLGTVNLMARTGCIRQR